MAERASRTTPRVFVTRSLAERALADLATDVELDVWPERRAPTPAELIERAADSDGLVCLLTDRIDAALLARCPRLRAVSSVSVGVDHVDLAAATARGIPVGNTPGVLTETTADLAFALLLDAARRVSEGDRFVRDGSWVPERVWEPDMLLGRDVHGATLGLVGMGAIGQAVARRAAGFGMRVLGVVAPRAIGAGRRVDLARRAARRVGLRERARRADATRRAGCSAPTRSRG